MAKGSRAWVKRILQAVQQQQHDKSKEMARARRDVVCRHTWSETARSAYCTRAWKPEFFSKVAIFCTSPKALKTRYSTSSVTTTSLCAAAASQSHTFLLVCFSVEAWTLVVRGKNSSRHTIRFSSDIRRTLEGFSAVEDEFTISCLVEYCR